MARRFLWLALVLALTSLSAWSQPLAAPKDLTVSTDGSVFRGRWKAVPGASYYEVWTKLYGNWRFDPKEAETSPFTSSFELRGTDDRMWFRVRAVTLSGEEGVFSEEVQATPSAPSPASPRPGGQAGSSASGDDFDPQAPPPEPPSSLFTVWTDAREIRLVWQAVPKATRYTVEELKDGVWTSLTKVEYPKPTTAVIKDKPQPGPYQFRVRAIGRNGRASEPSRATTAKISR